MVSTLDFESNNPSSILGMSSFFYSIILPNSSLKTHSINYHSSFSQMETLTQRKKHFYQQPRTNQWLNSWIELWKVHQFHFFTFAYIKQNITCDLHYFQCLFITDPADHAWGRYTRHPLAIYAIDVKGHEHHIALCIELLYYLLKHLSCLSPVTWYLAQLESSNVLFQPIYFRFLLQQVVVVRFRCSCALYCELYELGIVFLENLVLKHLPEWRSRMGFTIFEGPYVEMLV